MSSRFLALGLPAIGVVETEPLESRAVRHAAAVIAALLRSRNLLRVEIAYAGFSAAEFAVWIAMLVYAYEQGGTTTAGLIALAQLVPAALFAPVAGMLADRHAPARVLAAGYLVQAVGMGGAAASLLADGHPFVSYGLAALAATAVTTTRPTQAVLVPSLARTPDELTAVNVVSGWIESAMVLAGPALAGVLIAVSSPGVVFALFAGGGLVAAWLVLPVPSTSHRGEQPEDAPAAGVLAELGAGFRTLAEHPEPRIVVGLLAAEYLCWGALDVLSVVLAIDVLGLGGGGAGYLNAVFGAGCLLGATAGVALVGRPRLAPPLVAGAAVWGTTFALVGGFPSVAPAFALLAVGGVGRSLLDISGLTLLQRIAPPRVLSRVLGIRESLSMAGLAVGSIMVPPLVALGGPRAAFIATGGILIAVVVVRLRALAALDAAATVPIVEISLLRSLRIFAPLPAPALEGLAHSVTCIEVPAGAVVIRQGERGDRFYAIADGEVTVSTDGATLATLGRCESFGEIALLRDVPRTATVTARTAVTLYSLEREPFLIALTSHAPARHAADEIISERQPALAQP